MKTVLVTGGAGFIGSNLIRELLSGGQYRVAVVDNMDSSYEVAYKEDNLRPFDGHENFIFYKKDILDFAGLKKIFEKEKPEYVVHLAAKTDTRKAVADPYIYEAINIKGTINLLELAKDYGVKNFVFASSSSVYGNTASVPFKEDDAHSFAISPYGATKRSGEFFIYTYYHNFGLNSVCLRFFNAYGENNRPDMVPYIWTDKILRGEQIEISGGGSRKRDYTYVGDTVGAIIKALELKDAGFEILNIGYGRPYSLRELLAALEKVIGTKAKVKERPSHAASVEETCADIKKAKLILGWEPEVSLEDGLSRLVIWFKQNRMKNFK
ncbi:MAG: GDP-mannose 4,6-dehydratase [Candidatus Niyogibacteria bacterium]|nr:GDP-mannose 4,6-dehydratase [Candidatus Niyogibacteria bacterium]